MFREMSLLIVLVLLSILLLAKGDKQIVHLLEGKIFSKKAAIVDATTIYRNHKNIWSSIFFVFGFLCAGFSIILYSEKNSLYSLAIVVSILFVGLGIWGRLKAFNAADLELEADNHAVR